MEHDYKGCPIFIYDEDNNCIAKTVITEFHKNERTISIPGDTEGINRGAHLSIIVIHSEGASVYNGIAREVIANTRDISMFKGRHRQRRTHSRFLINTPAVIKSVTINSNRITFPVPKDVLVVNLSKSGALIKSLIKCFNIDTILEISMNTSEKDVLLRAQVKRESPNEDGTFDYGCVFIHKL